MADENDLTELAFGEPDDAAAVADETQRSADLLAAEAEVLSDVTRPTEAEVTVIVEEEIIAWPLGKRGLDLTPVQVAVYAGWTMAVLYGTITGAPAGHPAELPTVNELAPDRRRKLELARLRHLLRHLLPDFADDGAHFRIPTGDDEKEQNDRRSKLDSLNFEILRALTARQPKLQLAYQLGRSLRDTANPPGADGAAGADETAIATQLDRRRVAKLQEWLATLAPDFPAPTAAVVAGSLGRWSDLAAVTMSTTGTPQPRSRVAGLPRLRKLNGAAHIAESMRVYLLPQGDVWLMLLTGELVTSGLLTPEGYVSAGEAALRRSAAILRGIVRHYWFGLLCVAAALGFTLFLAARYLEGASKVWTSIACIAGALGASLQTIASTSARLAAEAERPVFAVAEDDAMAWAITTLPPLAATSWDAHQLRRAGIAPPAMLGRF
jgi:hypothetical protein